MDDSGSVPGHEPAAAAAVPSIRPVSFLLRRETRHQGIPVKADGQGIGILGERFHDKEVNTSGRRMGTDVSEVVSRAPSEGNFDDLRP